LRTVVSFTVLASAFGENRQKGDGHLAVCRRPLVLQS